MVLARNNKGINVKTGRRFVLGSERIDVFTLEMPDISILTAMFGLPAIWFTS